LTVVPKYRIESLLVDSAVQRNDGDRHRPVGDPHDAGLVTRLPHGTL
jgi:hypothetical protein